MVDLWIATGNEHKRRELDRLLSPLGYSLRLQSEAPAPLEVVEDCPDFAGNAAKKARALSSLVSAMAVADDSGLCVDALDGRPGVHSARYAGAGATDADRIQKLLQELAGVSDAERAARFVCCVCLTGGDGRILAAFECFCEGIILRAPRGHGGFGYDPVFVAQELLTGGTPLEQTPSFAELSPERKDAISHRGQALRKLRGFLQRLSAR
ncbi:MAG: RdgB/HAM1 family non-canonical purine NTP pyrophosphatase [Planctomycetota bacterium]|jgi:XTP/dITP diphosphohydrolase